MADLRIVGIDDTTGQRRQLDPGDALVDSSGSPATSTVTDWVSFTPTGTWTTNTTYTGQRRKVGDTLEIQYVATLSGVPNVSGLTFDIPSGFTVDAAKISAGEMIFGTGTILKPGTNRFGPIFGFYNGGGIAAAYPEIDAAVDMSPWKFVSDTLPANITPWVNLSEISLMVKFPVLA